MASVTLYNTVKTEASFEEVRSAVKKSFQIVGGKVEDTKTGLVIKNGTNEVKYSITAMSFSAEVNIKEVSEEKFELVCTVTWVPNYILHIIMFSLGFVTLVTWIYNILYFFLKPAPVYQKALDHVKSLLE